MDEIEELRRQLLDAQKARGTSKLSERSCVDLLRKLMATNRVQLLYTLSGREYLTPSHLEKECRAQLSAHGGRLNIVELNSLLGVDLSHIENAVDSIVKRDSSIQIQHGELISNDYIDTVVAEIDEAIADVGKLTIMELAKRFQLSAGFIRDIVAANVGKNVRGQLEQDALYTEAFVSRNAAQVQGILSAITRPTPCSTLLSAYDIPEKLFYSCAQELIANERVDGSIQRRTYIPGIFSRSREQYAKLFFDSNGFVEYALLERLGMSNARKYAKEHFQGVSLPTCIVHQATLDALDGNVSECINSEHWLDVRNYVPSLLSDKDVEELLQQCSSLHVQSKEANGFILNSYFVCTLALLKKCGEQIDELMTRKLEDGSLQGVVAPATDASNAKKDDDWSDEENDRSKKRRGGKSNKGRAAKRDDSVNTSKGGKQGKKGQSKSDALPDNAKSKTFECLKSVLLDDVDEEFYDALWIRHLVKLYTKSRDQARSTVFKSVKKADTKAQEEKYTNNVVSLHYFLQHLKNASAAVDNADHQSAIEKYVVKSLGYELIDAIVVHEARVSNVYIGDGIANVDGGVLAMSGAERDELVSRLPAALKAIILSLLATKDIGSFLDALDAAAHTLGLHLKSLDRKRERALVFTQRQQAMEELNKETDPCVVLHKALVILHIKACSQLLHVPGRLVSVLLERVREHIKKEAMSKLDKLHEFVVEALRSVQDSDAAVEYSEEALECANAVKEIAVDPATIEKRK